MKKVLIDEVGLNRTGLNAHILIGRLTLNNEAQQMLWRELKRYQKLCLKIIPQPLLIPQQKERSTL